MRCLSAPLNKDDRFLSVVPIVIYSLTKLGSNYILSNFYFSFYLECEELDQYKIRKEEIYCSISKKTLLIDFKSIRYNRLFCG